MSTYEQLIQGLLEKGFASVDNWLAPGELDCLRKSLLIHYEQERFHSAGIGNWENLQVVERIRNDHIYWLDAKKANDCERAFLEKIDDFVQYLNRTCFAGIRSFEFQYAFYEEGSFYKKHVDRFQNDDRRQFSMVFYLSEKWHEGDGGELLIYTDETVTRVEPVSGRVVFFRSEIPHEVLPTRIPRLSLTGWMKSI